MQKNGQKRDKKNDSRHGFFYLSKKGVMVFFNSP
jgi:hypothetical protein